MWGSPEERLGDITPHDYDEPEIFFLHDDNIVYFRKLIGSIRQPLTGSPLVYIGNVKGICREVYAFFSYCMWFLLYMVSIE